MEIVNIKTNNLIPYGNNAKMHSDEQINAVAESIKQFGFVQPLVIDECNEVVIGHCRLEAAKRLGLDTVPCVLTDGLTEEQIKALRLADNKLNESEWDAELLEMELAGILDIDMSTLGFEEMNIDELSDEFELKSGDRDPIQNMTFTFSDTEADVIKAAIAEMKQSKKFEDYDNPDNKNSNGNALFLVVEEWYRQRI